MHPLGSVSGNTVQIRKLSGTKKSCFLENEWEQIVKDSRNIGTSEVYQTTEMGITSNNASFSETIHRLCLLFYDDELDIVNSLGSKKNKSKLCAIYYIVETISDRYRSRVSHVHLALMVCYIHLQECAIDIIQYFIILY